MSDDPTRPADSLEEARETIARQRQEIERLQRRLADERFVEDLRHALTLAGVAGVVAVPTSHSRLLEMIVKTAAHVISAQAASLLLIDKEHDDLVFEVAVGGEAEKVSKLRVPLGHGIAGLVALTGQAMAVSNARNDPRQARDIAERVGYVPDSLLCVPLIYEDEVIGVLELLDKQGAPSFSAADMEALGLFAGQAAIAIEQSRIYRDLSALVGEALASLPGIGDERTGLLRQASAFTGHLQREDRLYHRARELAQLVRDIAAHGEGEAVACREILEGFARYLRTRPASEWGEA